MNWFALFILSMVMIFTPYQKGLFFDSDLYVLEVSIGVLFVIYGIWLVFKKKTIQGAYLTVFLLPLMYLITISVAESPKGNYDALFRWAFYGFVFYILVELQTTDKLKKLLPLIFQMSGIVMVGLALVGYWGWAQFHDLFVSGRLTGTFQYPNTFGTLMGAFWLYSLVVLSKKSIKPGMAIFYSLPLVGYLSSLLLSESRGTFLVLPFAWFISLILLGVKQQLIYIINTLISVGISLVVYRKMVALKLAGAVSPGMVIFVIGTILSIILIVIITYLLRGDKLDLRLDKNRKFKFILPIVMVVLGIALALDITHQGMVYQHLPSTLQERMATMNSGTSSVLGRTAFYEDGMKMSKDAPILGLGGSGWKVLFTKYQHQPYWSTQTHNGYLEVLLNTGWLGILIFISVIAFLLIQVFRRYRNERGDVEQIMTAATLPALLIIFMHAFIDFDFSFGTVWMVVFWLLAMGVLEQQETKPTSFLPPWIEKTILAICTIFAIFICFQTLQFHFAETEVAAGQEKGQQLTFQQALTIYENTMFYNPYNVTNLSKLTDLYVQAYQQSKQEPFKQKALGALNQLEALEPNNPEVLLSLGREYLALGDWNKGLDYLNKDLAVDRFNVKAYDNSIYVKSTLAIQSIKDPNKSSEFAKAALKDYADYNQLFEPYKKEPIPDMRPLDLDKKSYFYAAQAQFLMGQYQQTLDILNHINEQDDKQLQKQTDAVRILAYEQLNDQSEANRLKENESKANTDFLSFLDNYRKQVGK